MKDMTNQKTIKNIKAAPKFRGIAECSPLLGEITIIIIEKIVMINAREVIAILSIFFMKSLKFVFYLFKPKHILPKFFVYSS
jgi:hypothetical protein